MATKEGVLCLPECFKNPKQKHKGGIGLAPVLAWRGLMFARRGPFWGNPHQDCRVSTCPNN